MLSIGQINRKSGLVRLIIIIIIGIIILSYFGIDIKSIVESEQSQDNLGYVWGFVVSVWQNYLSRPVLYFWNNFFVDLLWDTFVSNFERIKRGEQTDFELNTPSVDLN